MAGFTPGLLSVDGLLKGTLSLSGPQDLFTGYVNSGNYNYYLRPSNNRAVQYGFITTPYDFDEQWCREHASTSGYVFTDIIALDVRKVADPLERYGLYMQIGLWISGSDTFNVVGRWQLRKLGDLTAIYTSGNSIPMQLLSEAKFITMVIGSSIENGNLVLGISFGYPTRQQSWDPFNMRYFGAGTSYNVGTGNGLVNLLTYRVGKLMIEDPNEQDGGDPDDEDKPGGNSGTGGGNGSYTIIKDNIPIPNMPTLTAGAAGFVTLYNPSAAILKLLADELNSDNVIQWIINYFEKPQDMVAGLGIVPVQPVTIGSHKPKLGSKSIDIAMPVIEDQFVEKDCGTLEIYKFYGSAFDYSPYSQIQIFLPYIGLKELNVDEVMGKTIGVKYHIDLFTGNCVAFVTVYNSGNEAVRYQFSGNCLQQIPINATSYDDAITNGIRLATMAVASIATAGAAGAAAGAAATEAGATAAEASTAAAVAESATAAEAGRELVGSTLSAIMTSKPHVERSGSLGGSIGLMSVQTPFIVRIIPRQSLPENYKHYAGYPSNITATLSSLSGFTKMEKINLTGISATDDELSEIYKLLYSGVIL